jgi:hypothetical protein
MNANTGAASRAQLPRTPLPPANQSSVLSSMYGHVEGSAVSWDDGATWDGKAPIPTLPGISKVLLPGLVRPLLCPCLG